MVLHADDLEATRRNPARLAAVHATGLVDSEVEEVFDRLTRLVVRLLGVPAAFISLVDAERDFYKSACGFGEPIASARELTGPTFCHYTVQRTTPLVIPDTDADPRYRDVPTVRTLGVAAYVGVPLAVDGQIIGAFCAIDTQPRAWTPDEVEVLVELAASAQREMELRGAIAVALATTARLEERTVEAELANKSKGQFLSMMSHELRTPLNAIGGYAELLGLGVRGPITPDQKDFLDRIQRAAKHLHVLIGEILEFSRIDAGQIRYEIEDVVVIDVIAEAVDLLAPQMGERGIAFDRGECASSAGGVPYTVKADAKRLLQILINLLTNAIKFTPAGGRVWLTCDYHASRVFIAVSDSGRGVPPGELSNIFDPFVQIDRGSTPTGHQGVGLGLAICRELARGMQGDLVVRSEVGVGSTFTITLPATQQSATPLALSHAPPSRVDLDPRREPG